MGRTMRGTMRKGCGGHGKRGRWYTPRRSPRRRLFTPRRASSNWATSPRRREGMRLLYARRRMLAPHALATIPSPLCAGSLVMWCPQHHLVPRVLLLSTWHGYSSLCPRAVSAVPVSPFRPRVFFSSRGVGPARCAQPRGPPRGGDAHAVRATEDAPLVCSLARSDFVRRRSLRHLRRALDAFFHSENGAGASKCRAEMGHVYSSRPVRRRR
ncbi:hypothetical protein FB451DRAFT_1300361, partial [Mycena latifolia]